MRVDGIELADPEGQLLVRGRVRPEELLLLGELVEAGAGVVGVQVLDEDRDQQTCLTEAAFGELPEQFTHRVSLAVEVEVELADSGPAGQDRVHFGVGRGSLQPGLADQELPASGFQRGPFRGAAVVTRH
jgi:hypothetical protein